jgi:hypothetical protein
MNSSPPWGWRLLGAPLRGCVGWVVFGGGRRSGCRSARVSFADVQNCASGRTVRRIWNSIRPPKSDPEPASGYCKYRKQYKVSPSSAKLETARLNYDEKLAIPIPNLPPRHGTPTDRTLPYDPADTNLTLRPGPFSEAVYARRCA